CASGKAQLSERAKNPARSIEPQAAPLCRPGFRARKGLEDAESHRGCDRLRPPESDHVARQRGELGAPRWPKFDQSRACLVDHLQRAVEALHAGLIVVEGLDRRESPRIDGGSVEADMCPPGLVTGSREALVEHIQVDEP